MSRPCARGTAGALVAALVALAPLEPARAQARAPETEAAPDPAREAFTQGAALLRAQRYAEALGSFERSYQLRRVAAVALNLGVVLIELGRYVEANQRFQEFFELASPAQRERFAQEVSEHLADLRRRAGRLRISELRPESALVLLDGRRAPLDEQRELLVDPGEHVLQVEAAGFRSQRESVRVEAGQLRDVRFALVSERDSAPTSSAVVPPPTPSPTPTPSSAAGGAPARAGVPGWVLPVSIAAGAVVLGAAAAGVWYVASEPAPLPPPNTGVTVELLSVAPWRPPPRLPLFVLSGRF